MNAPFLHRSLTESKNTFLNGVLTSDIIYGDSGSFNTHSDIWTYQYEQVFPMLYGEGYTIHEHLAPFRLVYLKERTGFFAEEPDIGTSGFYNNLSIDDDLGNANSSIETGCNTHRQTDWVKDKPGQEAYFDKNVTSKDDPDLKGRIYVGKTFIELRENNFLYYGDEKGDLHQLPLPIFGLKEDTREADGQEGITFEQAKLWYQFGGGARMDVNLNSIDLSCVRMSDFNSRGLATVRLAGKHFSNLNDALVHGTITLQRIGNTNQAKIALNSDPTTPQLNGQHAAMYDFEMHSWGKAINWVRNPETFIAGLINWLMPMPIMPGGFIYVDGTGFPIYYNGTATIKP
jgi:hypothetical protein